MQATDPGALNSIQIPTDGFAFNPAYWLNPYSYSAGALAQMEVLRRAATYRPRWYMVPDEINQPVPAYTTLEYGIKVTAGSYLWGWRFLQLNSRTWAQAAATGVVVQITEVCTGIPLMREFTEGSAFAQWNASPQARGIILPSILTQPRLFLEPGDITVEICNLGSSPVDCCLLLHFAEPCELIEGE